MSRTYFNLKVSSRVAGEPAVVTEDDLQDFDPSSVEDVALLLRCWENGTMPTPLPDLRLVSGLVPIFLQRPKAAE